MPASPLAYTEREDIAPVCPHCDAQLTEIHTRRKGVPMGQGRTIVFLCPECHKILGMGQERMI